MLVLDQGIERASTLVGRLKRRERLLTRARDRIRIAKTDLFPEAGPQQERDDGHPPFGGPLEDGRQLASADEIRIEERRADEDHGREDVVEDRFDPLLPRVASREIAVAEDVERAFSPHRAQMDEEPIKPARVRVRVANEHSLPLVVCALHEGVDRDGASHRLQGGRGVVGQLRRSVGLTRRRRLRDALALRPTFASPGGAGAEEAGSSLRSTCG